MKCFDTALGLRRWGLVVLLPCLLLQLPRSYVTQWVANIIYHKIKIYRSKLWWSHQNATHIRDFSLRRDFFWEIIILHIVDLCRKGVE